MESSVAEFLKRQSACELLATTGSDNIKVVVGTVYVLLSNILSAVDDQHPCGTGNSIISDV